MSDEKLSDFMRKRREDYQKRAAEDKRSATLKAEYEFLQRNFSDAELEYDLHKQCLDMSKMTYLVHVVYFGFLYSNEKRVNFNWGPGDRASERMRCLMIDNHLSPKDIELIVEIAREVNHPRPGAAHEESIKNCLECARRWVDGADEGSSEGLDALSIYAKLKAHITDIVGSAFFTSPAPSVLEEEDYGNENYFSQTLEEWLNQNNTEILGKIELIGSEIIISEWRLQEKIRIIIGRIMMKLKNLHDRSYVCTTLTIQNIFVSHSLDVKLHDGVKLTRDTSFKDDFRKLKLVIDCILKCAYSSIRGSSCPEDLQHYMELLSGPSGEQWNEGTRILWYRHPCIWSDYDVIKNVCLIFAVYNSSSSSTYEEICKQADLISPMIPRIWNFRIPDGSPYDKLQKGGGRKWASIPNSLKILYFMRDAYPHINNYISYSERQSLIKTENELFAMFPTYLAHFVERTCTVKDFLGLYELPALTYKSE